MFMLAKDLVPSRLEYPAIVQPKLNGVRAQLKEGHFVSRTEIPYPAMGLMDFPAVLDGEIYRHGWTLQRILGAVSCEEKTADSDELSFFAFDIVAEAPQIDRLKVLTALTLPSRVHLVPWLVCEDFEQINNTYQQFLGEGYEGIVIRNSSATYQGGRSWNLMRLKPWNEEDFECIGVTSGKGKFAGSMGALILADGNLVFKCGGGNLSEKERQQFSLQPPIGKRIRIKYDGRSEAGIPLKPQFISVVA